MVLHVRGRLTALAAVVLIVGLAACSSSSSTGARASASAQGSQARQVLQSATANPSVQAAISRAKTTVINPCIDASNGPDSFKNCVYARVPKSTRVTVRHCMEKAALNDHLSTEAGKQAWFNDAALCVSAVLPPAPATPAAAKPSPSTS